MSLLNSMRDPPVASRCEHCGCPQSATEFVTQRCPTVVDPMCRKPGSDDLDAVQRAQDFAVQRKHRNKQMALDPLAQLVPDRAQPEFGLERLECGFQFSQSPVSTNRLLNAPLRVAGAQDIMARSGIVRIIRRIALPDNGPGLAVRRLRDGDIIVVVDHTRKQSRKSSADMMPVASRLLRSTRTNHLSRPCRNERSEVDGNGASGTISHCDSRP